MARRASPGAWWISVLRNWEMFICWKTYQNQIVDCWTFKLLISHGCQRQLISFHSGHLFKEVHMYKNIESQSFKPLVSPTRSLASWTGSGSWVRHARTLVTSRWDHYAIILRKSISLCTSLEAILKIFKSVLVSSTSSVNKWFALSRWVIPKPPKLVGLARTGIFGS